MDEIAESSGTPSVVPEVERIFSETGILSRSSNFEYRPQQQQMGRAVATALESGSHLIVEAGTGVGKSLGYLIPSILYAVSRKKKAVVSTHTINLQEQLIDKDLPMLEKALPVGFRYTMLKGRRNYLCTRRLHKAMGQAPQLFTSPEEAELRRIFEWSKETKDGSLSDFDTEPNHRVWAEVCSERGLCSPKLCGPASEFGKQFGPCFYQQARARILVADVLVLNHTLFFTQLGTMDEETAGDGILFKNDFVIFDEAHTVEAVASKHIGIAVSNSQARFALHRLYNPQTRKGLLGSMAHTKVASLVEECLDQAQVFFNQLEAACDDIVERQAAAERKRGGQAYSSWNELRIRKPDIVKDSLHQPLTSLREAISDLIKQAENKESATELMEANTRILELRDSVSFFLRHDAPGFVYWVDRAGKQQTIFTLNAAPIDVAEYLRRRLFGSRSSVIMTSATLSIAAGVTAQPVSRTAPVRPGPKSDAGLDYFARRVGGERSTKLQVGSPFDYERQMKVFVTAKMPDPREPEYNRAILHWIEHFIRKTHGKAFVLFTNMKLMHQVAQDMEPTFNELGINCFVQGTGTPRSIMLEKFKDDVHSVLFGAESFWQGVDVPGEALSNVIITRLPFAVPDHPLIEARVEQIEARGGNSFREFSLPEAILKFRQGVGRLIRTKSDSGIVAILDNRVLTKAYGKAFLESIPNCPVEIV
ncbi:MAG TPA: helicase C-terminal domain-containing protein [Methylomirabilota bacterium]|nr:helicase C-terminal domain-containing protein [Methylomirabilota bacterium]